MPDLDQLLRQTGQQWRDAVKAQPAQVRLAQPPLAPVRRSQLVLATAAVLVVLIGLGSGGYWLVHGSGSKQIPASPAAQASADPLRSSQDWQNHPLQQLTLVPADVVTKPGNHGMPWRFLTLSSDERQLTFVYAGGDGDCTRVLGVAVSETSSQVTVEPIAHSDYSRSACKDSELIMRASITLARPLGQRQLLHPVLPAALAVLSKLL